MTPGRIGRILARHRRGLVRALSGRLRRLRFPDLDPEDVLQDAALLALAKLDRLSARTERGILLWILRAAEHEARNRVRVGALRRGPSLDALAASGASWLPSPARSPLDSSLRAELRALVRETRAQLSVPHYLVIELRDFEGLAWSDVAERLGGRSVHAAQELHRRAVGALGRRLRRRLP